MKSQVSFLLANHLRKLFGASHRFAMVVEGETPSSVTKRSLRSEKENTLTCWKTVYRIVELSMLGV